MHPTKGGHLHTVLEARFPRWPVLVLLYGSTWCATPVQSNSQFIHQGRKKRNLARSLYQRLVPSLGECSCSKKIWDVKKDKVRLQAPPPLERHFFHRVDVDRRCFVQTIFLKTSRQDARGAKRPNPCREGAPSSNRAVHGTSGCCTALRYARVRGGRVWLGSCAAVFFFATRTLFFSLSVFCGRLFI